MPTDPRDSRVDTRLRTAIEAGQLPQELLVCGPAGTGKTFGILEVLHSILADYPGLRCLIVRQVRASLAQSVLVTYEQEVLPADGMEGLAYGCTRRNRESYVYPNSSELAVCGLDRPGKALSSSWDIIYVNESIELSEEGWDALASRLNRPGRPRWLGWMIGDTNPGDPSHWLKVRCDDGRTALWDTTHRANPAMFERAAGAWTAAGRQYLDRLERLRGTRRKRFLDGLWAAGEGLWFESFEASAHVSEAADYDWTLPVHLAIDSGVYTGATAFQRRPQPEGHDLVTVFWNYLSEGLSARANAKAIVAGLAGRTGRKLRVTTDPAGGSRNPVGPTVVAEYLAEGLRTEPWPHGSVADALALVEGLLAPVGGAPRLLVHPTCTRLTTAFANYRRRKRAGQWCDEPEDPQHPHEDLIDALRGGLRAEFPDGLKKVQFRTHKAQHRVFH